MKQQNNHLTKRQKQTMNILSLFFHKVVYWVIAIILTALSLYSCQESLEEKAQRQASDYTRKYCPTPIDNNTRTDSIVFDRDRKVYFYYISFFNQLDNQDVVNDNRTLFAEMLTQSVKDSPSLRTFLEAGFRFEYICYSGSKPGKILIRIKI